MARIVADASVSAGTVCAEWGAAASNPGVLSRRMRVELSVAAVEARSGCAFACVFPFEVLGVGNVFDGSTAGECIVGAFGRVSLPLEVRNALWCR